MAQDFMGWPNFNTVPDTIKNGETKTQARSIKKEEATSPKTNRLAGVEGLAQVSLPDGLQIRRTRQLGTLHNL